MNYLSNFINYLQATKNLSPKTLTAYKSDLNQFLAFEENIFHPDICSYVSYLKINSDLKDSSIRRKIISLKIFYDYLLNQEKITASPFSRLRFKFKQERKLPKTLSVNEISKILNCFNLDRTLLTAFAKKEYIRDAALIDLLISTGIRIGEAAAMTLDDVITSERTLLIHGKGRKQRLIYISSSVTWERLKGSTHATHTTALASGKRRLRILQHASSRTLRSTQQTKPARLSLQQAHSFKPTFKSCVCLTQ